MEQIPNCRIAILMTVHNRCETTLKCLRCIDGMVYDKDLIGIDIYMTDDGSTDGTADAVSRFFPSVTIVKGDGSLYWNRGMYVAWQAAAVRDYDFFWWVNDDTFVLPDTLQRLLDSSRLHSDMALIVGSTCASDDSRQVTYGGWKGHALITDLDHEQSCDTINGNLVFVPRSVFVRIGMNDPYYRHSLGDTDYGLRAKEQGIEIFTAPGILGICDRHEHPTVWMDPEQPFGKRWHNFFSPTGNNPFEFFHFRKKHFGLFPAFFTFISNFTHFLFPRLWRHVL